MLHETRLARLEDEDNQVQVEDKKEENAEEEEAAQAHEEIRAIWKSGQVTYWSETRRRSIISAGC